MTGNLLKQNLRRIYIYSGSSPWCHVSSLQSVNREVTLKDFGKRSFLRLKSAKRGQAEHPEVRWNKQHVVKTLTSAQRKHREPWCPRGHSFKSASTFASFKRLLVSGPVALCSEEGTQETRGDGRKSVLFKVRHPEMMGVGLGPQSFTLGIQWHKGLLQGEKRGTENRAGK